MQVGQAIRIAQLEGLHTQLPEDELGVDIVMRCRNLWWTLYVMDRHFSSSLGLPMSTQDSDITALVNIPGTSSQQDSLLGLQVRLSRLLSFIIRSMFHSRSLRRQPLLIPICASHLQDGADAAWRLSRGNQVHPT